MKIEISENELFSLYDKAKQKYRECINNKENYFLVEEINFPLESILLEEKDIKIVFSKNIAPGFFLEATLRLIAGDIEIGKYTYVESETGNELDDSLFFF